MAIIGSLSQIRRRRVSGVVPADAVTVTGTIWNAADATAGAAITNGSRTLTGAAAARATTGKPSSTGSGYFEIVYNGANNNDTLGIATADTPLTSAIGTSGTGFAAGYLRSGEIFVNAAQIGTGAALVAGDVIGQLMETGKWYVSLNGVWQLSANPVTNTGGVVLTSATYYPVARPTVSGSSFTISTAPQYTPSGRSAWN